MAKQREIIFTHIKDLLLRLTKVAVRQLTCKCRTCAVKIAHDTSNRRLLICANDRPVGGWASSAPSGEL
jgi:hypothetical protein